MCGQKDEYNRETFADAFNFLLYDGKQTIKPENLKPLDTTSIALPFGDDGNVVPIQKYRDILKTATVMKDDRAAYILLGIENQSEINYAMPVRNMLYDAIQYAEQIEKIKQGRRGKGKRSASREEFLSGLRRTDKLIPVITLTVCFTPNKWTGPKDLHSMLKADEDILRFVDNYRLHLIAPANLSEKDFAKFRTELSVVLKFVEYSNDKKKLRKKISEDAAFKSVSKKTVDMVNAMTNSNIRYNEEEERVDMCEAIKELINDALAEGEAKGIAKGIAKGKAKGKAEGALETLAGLVKKGLLTVAQAAEEAHMSVAEFKKKAKALA